MIVLIGCLIFGCDWVVGKKMVLQRAMWYVASHINTSHLGPGKDDGYHGGPAHIHAHTHQDQVPSCPEQPQGSDKRILENWAIWI